MEQLEQTLIKQLEKGGLESNFIPGFIRSLATTLSLNPQLNHLQINERLQYLGWDGFELDYHTLQLAVACFETNGIENIEKKPLD